jgi:cholest-4-en-3-one 26-monooxygenase
MPCPALPDGFDLTDPDLLHHRVPLPEFAELRRTEPVHWVPQAPGLAGFGDEGYWAVTRHADVKYVSTHPELYSSFLNTAIIRFNEHIERDAIDAQRLILLNMDPPEHTRVRQIVQRVFTPRAIRALEDNLRDRAHAIAREALAQPGPFDFVTQVACELPLQAIAELIGIPQDDRAKIFEWSNRMISYDDPEYAITEEVGQESATELIAYAMNMAADRKQCPAKDIVSTLVVAEDEGSLASDEFGFFVLMLAVAGNETTRNAITHGMHAFLTHPDQWDLFKRERPATAAEEIVRWATPVNSFQRTATQDTELGGKRIKKGDRVGIFYASANHDPEVFENPDTFDITRDPNPHLGFGGGGPHFCLGRHLAKLEVECLFRSLITKCERVELVAEPRRLRSNFINGIKEMQVRFIPASA